MTRIASTDVVVAGGGPAGATIAATLASYGHDVMLIEKYRFPRDQIGESLTPSIIPLLTTVGIRETVEKAGFLRMAGHTVCWGSSEPRTSYFGLAQQRFGFQAVRADFDLMLLDHARANGVRVIEGRSVRTVTYSEEPPVKVTYDRNERVRAKFFVDATGHSGLLAQQHRRQKDPFFRTLAISAYWQGAAGPKGIDFANTLLETYQDGMVWSVPLHTGLRNCTVLIDWSAGAAMRKIGRQRMYTQELSKADYVPSFLNEATLAVPVRVFDASLYTSNTFITDRTLSVGDAGLSIDPLSSEGVRKAMASSITGAAVINTMLRRPSLISHAKDLYTTTQEDIYKQHYDQSRRYYGDENRWPERPFWRSRSTRLEQATVSKDIPGPATGFSPFDARPVSRLVLADGATVQSRPVIEGSYVELRAVVTSPRHSGGIRFIAGVDVAALATCVQKHGDVTDCLEAFRREKHRGADDLSKVRRALAQLCQEGILKPQ